LLICNHVSYADALVISAGIWRPVRFVMDHRIYKLPVLHWIFKTSKTIPIASRRENPQLLEQAYQEIVQALRNGELVCIFPEGVITRDGELADFRPGLLRILGEISVPVIPLGVAGLWGSIFSRAPLVEKLTRYFRPFRKIYLRAGESVAPEAAELVALRTEVLGLRGIRR
ncbi:MAG TPA: 1-acyl-sn-glycerol-3-phosphate acyltransferase, partial [Gammaproteobacteria bacterium]